MGICCYSKIITPPNYFTQMNKIFPEENNTIFVFTRYLYEKDEVKIALLIALLNKKEDEAVFWAYELYHSGFVCELVNILWKIYYDFYATLNPAFEEYLSSSFTNVLDTNSNNEKLIYTIINDFIIKPYNVDVFILDQLRSTNIEKDYLENLSNFKTFKKTFELWLDSYDYINIALYVLDDCPEEDLDGLVESCVLYFKNYIVKMDKRKIISQIKNIQMKNNQNKRKIILSRIIGYYSILSNLKMGKNIKFDNEDNNFEFYKTIVSNSIDDNNKYNSIRLPSHKILANVCQYSIDSTHHLSLFHLKRDNYDIKNSYLNNWLYFASFSPIWKERITQQNGVVNDEKKTVTFYDDDDMENFHNKYNYEPDEQKKEIQNKCIKNIENLRTWRSFYEEHVKNCLIDIDTSYLSELTKIHY